MNTTSIIVVVVLALAGLFGVGLLLVAILGDLPHDDHRGRA